MTMQELRDLVSDLSAKTDTLIRRSQDLRQLEEELATLIRPEALGLSQLNADTLVAEYTPLYFAHLTAIETASDALGTDAFH